MTGEIAPAVPAPAGSLAAVHGPVHQLGPEWVRGADGVRFRHAARVILLDPSDRVLLLHGCDVDQRERSWWFTVGGGLEAGESTRDAAVRELFEETGVTLAPTALVGPVFTRSATFDFFRETCRQEESFYLARYDERLVDAARDDAARGDALATPDAVGHGGRAEFSRAGWTQIEVDTIDELRWWALDDLAAAQEEIFPARLEELVRALLGGWDGVTRQLDA